jgi:hypothetical protein
MPPLLQESFISKLSTLQDWEKSLMLSTLQRITSLMSAEDLEVAPVLSAGPVEASVEAISTMYEDSTSDDDEDEGSKQYAGTHNQ